MNKEILEAIEHSDATWNQEREYELAQQSMNAEGEKYETPGMAEMIRSVGAQSIVMLENVDQTLPITADRKVAVFGRCQVDTFYVGYGSGGDVNPTHRISLLQGLEEDESIQIDEAVSDAYRKFSEEHPVGNYMWGHWPFFYEEMPVEDSFVEEAARNNDTAIVIIGRAAGEDRENYLGKGSFYLTDLEEDLLSKVNKNFSKVVVLMNIGNIIDFSWVEKYEHITALLMVWQLGQETGYAIADVLSGKVNPSGHLTATIAKNYEDYPSAKNFGGEDENVYEEGVFVGYRYFESKAPDRVLYHFGQGLSYTNFSVRPERFSHTPGLTEVRASAKNMGAVPGKGVIQIYAAQETPGSPLEKPVYILVAYAKTGELKPFESEEQAFTISDYQLASYDADGLTGHKSAYVLEKGTYRFYVGTSSAREDLTEIGFFVQEETYVVRQCEQVSTESNEDRKRRILGRLPKEIPFTGDQGIDFKDVKSGKNTLDEFIAQLTPYDLADLTWGQGMMNSEFATPGNTGVFGGITEALRDKGIPAVNTSDGPSGLRLMRYCSLLPIGTALASSFDDHLVNRMFRLLAKEMQHYNVHILLAPGMNIHRNPLCGRNFEYYSEDPYLTGWMGAAAVDGIQSQGASACPKHFACNNQETNRNYNNSIVDERTLREIYLRGFEMMVSIAKPKNLMTSYNKVNGVWSHYNYDLVTTVLRGEWGYEGNVVTDWWMRPEESHEFPGVRDNAYRIRAGVDVLMPGWGTPQDQKYVHCPEVEEAMNVPDGLTLGELQSVARHVLTFALSTME